MGGRQRLIDLSCVRAAAPGRAAPRLAAVRHVLHLAGRWSSPTGLILAGLCFALPFVTVACDTPGGFGRAAPGGTTTYTGVDLIIGDRPDVSPPERLRPAAEWRDDQIGAQPLATIVVLLVLAGLVAAIALADAGYRRATVATAAAGALVLLILNQAFVNGALTSMVGEQVTQPLPAGKELKDYVNTGPGFVLCAALLLAVAIPNTIGWLQLRSRRNHAPPPVAYAPSVSPGAPSVHL